MSTEEQEEAAEDSVFTELEEQADQAFSMFLYRVLALLTVAGYGMLYMEDGFVSVESNLFLIVGGLFVVAAEVRGIRRDMGSHDHTHE